MKYDTMTIKRENAEIMVNAFKRNFKPSFEYTSKSGNVKILFLEKHNLRTNSTLATTMPFDLEDKDSCIINIVISGGKVGLAQLDWGAENATLKGIKRFFQKSGCEKVWKEV